MDSKRREIRAWPTAAVLALSLLLHAALLFLPLPGSRHESPRGDSSRMAVELLPRPAEPTPEPPERIPEPERRPQKEPQKPGEQMASEPAVATRSPMEQSRPTETSSGAEPIHAITPAQRIQDQLLSTARKLGQESERSEDDTGLKYNEAPALPSQPGWLDQYTGRVTPSIDRWKGRDGSRNARVVTGSGQVFCIRTRAPTTAEIFNPWMSSAVGMIRDCGRERPQAADGGDPWLRQPRAGGE